MDDDFYDDSYSTDISNGSSYSGGSGNSLSGVAAFLIGIVFLLAIVIIFI